MNLGQAIRQALFDCDLVLRDGTTSPQFTETELVSWASQGKDKVESILRRNDEDFNLIFRSSTDSSFRWDGITYAPSSFQLTTTARSYTLPPDVLLVRRIRAVTSGEEEREFLHKDMSSEEFRDQEQAASTDTTPGRILWDLVGERTLRIARSPDVVLDIEIAYIPRSRRARLYSTGTVDLTQDSSSVIGTSTLWVDEELDSFADLIPAAAAAAPKIASQTIGGTFVDPTAVYPRISTITSDTAITLLGNWLLANRSGVGYIIAPRFPFPEEYDRLVVDWVAYRILKKARSTGQTTFKEAFDEASKELLDDTSKRQTADPEYVEDFTYD